MTIKHTPGPWFAAPSDETTNARYVRTKGGDIITLLDWAPTDQEIKSNARLIAAAPDLLAACEHAAISIHHPACKHDHPKKCTCHVGEARAAIFKAKVSPEESTPPSSKPKESTP